MRAGTKSHNAGKGTNRSSKDVIRSVCSEKGKWLQPAEGTGSNDKPPDEDLPYWDRQKRGRTRVRAER